MVPVRESASFSNRPRTDAQPILRAYFGMIGLPTELQDLTNHSAFRRQLKTFLFERAFSTQWLTCRWWPGCRPKRCTVCIVHRTCSYGLGFGHGRPHTDASF